jgi:hypothetical protein
MRANTKGIIERATSLRKKLNHCLAHPCKIWQCFYLTTLCIGNGFNCIGKHVTCLLHECDIREILYKSFGNGVDAALFGDDRLDNGDIAELRKSRARTGDKFGISGMLQHSSSEKQQQLNENLP